MILSKVGHKHTGDTHMNCNCRNTVASWSRSNNTRTFMDGWPSKASTVTCNDCGLNVPHISAMGRALNQSSLDDIAKAWAWRHGAKSYSPGMQVFAVWDALKVTTRRDLCHVVGVELKHAELPGIPTEAKQVLDLYSHPLPSWA